MVQTSQLILVCFHVNHEVCNPLSYGALTHAFCLAAEAQSLRLITKCLSIYILSNERNGLPLAERFVHIRFAYSSYKCLTREVIMNGIGPEQELFEPFCRIPFMNKEVSIPKRYRI